MNWAQFKDTVSHMCLARTVVASLYTGGGRFEPFYCNDKYFLSLNLLNSKISVKTFRKKSVVRCTSLAIVFRNFLISVFFISYFRQGNFTNRFPLLLQMISQVTSMSFIMSIHNV